MNADSELLDPRLLGVLIAATLAITGLWLALPDKTFVFDGVMFSGFVERSVAEWRDELYNPRHLLFCPALQLLRDGLAAMRLPIEAYRLFQIVNAVLGAIGLWLFGDLLRRLTRRAWPAAAGAFLLAMTWTYSTRATEGQVYMFLAVGGIWILWSAVRLLESPSGPRALMLGASLAGASLFHAAAAFLAPAAAWAIYRAFPNKPSKFVAPTLTFFAVLLVPYVFIFGSLGLKPFFSKATDFYGGSGGGYVSGLISNFWHGGGLSLGGRLDLVLRDTAHGLAVLPRSFAVVAGVLFWAAMLGNILASWKKLDAFRRDAAVVLLLAWGACQFLSAFWPGGLFFQTIPAVLMISLFFVSQSVSLEARPVTGAATAAVVALALGAWNFGAGIVPQSKIESNEGLALTYFVRDHTVPSSWVMISGFGYPNAKVYLPNFAARSREVLEYYFDRMPKAEAAKAVSAFVDLQTRNGVPLYLLSDLVEDPKAAAEMKKRWNLETGELQALFGPGRVLGVASNAAPRLNVYLYAPAGREPELFAGLAFSVLTESDAKRLGECVNLLKQLAAGMSPAERAKTAKRIKDSWWGYRGLSAGFAPYLGRDAAAALADREKRFTDYEQTADFWLRAGNIYRILGLKAEVIESWTKAQKLSGNVDLLKDIEAYRKQR